jgi:hypothetical protein
MNTLSFQYLGTLASLRSCLLSIRTAASLNRPEPVTPEPPPLLGMMLRMALLALAALLPQLGTALDNGLARTPPMGWMTWERFRCTASKRPGNPTTGPSCKSDPDNCISDRLVRQHADILAQPEWAAAGYRYVNIDDCWANWNRTSDGKLAPDSTRFPQGLKSLADYVHAKGLKLGTYNDMGTATCGKYPGECKDEVCTLPGYMTVDAQVRGTRMRTHVRCNVTQRCMLLLLSPLHCCCTRCRHMQAGASTH